jgi:hypothetical protein
MTRKEFIAILEPFRLAMRADLDAPTLSAYFRVLENIPAVLFEAAIEDYLSKPLEFFPKAPEMRAACELQRRRQLALMPPYEGCVECEDHKGWRPVRGADGYERLERCACRGRYQERLESRGLLAAVAQLPGEAEPQGEQYYPTVEQLPADMRKSLLETVRQKVLR